MFYFQADITSTLLVSAVLILSCNAFWFVSNELPQLNHYTFGFDADQA